ncbi:uncharacterized protein RJT21DRAFT_117418 [Scheffersomyces amazonensis]|uniref:uncharacterized protein n=1 Tax=Scheffersomyces amazonensis TaxID=1078765 RepID=UPI00315DC459
MVYNTTYLSYDLIIKMDESFHFALLRISITQILKANGFDKCKPSTLNVVTDIYIQYLKKLINQVKECTTTKENIEVIDVFQALSLIESVKPSNFIKLPPKYNQNDLESSSILTDIDTQQKVSNTKSIESFKNWIEYSDPFRLSYRLNQLPSTLIKNLIEKRKLSVNDGETDQERRKRKRKERQEYYNQLNLMDQNQSQAGIQDDDDDEDILTSKDRLLWINYLIEKDLKLGHDLKFINSSLETEFLKFQSNQKFHPDQQNIQLHNLNKHDYIIINIDQNDKQDDDTEQQQQNITTEQNIEAIRPSEKLTQLLPYNIKYDKTLLEDDLEKLINNNKNNNNNNKISDNADDQIESGADHDISRDIIEQDDEDILIREEGIGGDNSLMFL